MYKNCFVDRCCYGFKENVFICMLAFTIPPVFGDYERQRRTFLVLQQRQNLGGRFGASKMQLNLPAPKAAVHSKVVVLLLLTFCLMLLSLWESVIVLCFAVRYFMSILVLQSS